MNPTVAKELGIDIAGFQRHLEQKWELRKPVGIRFNAPRVLLRSRIEVPEVKEDPDGLRISNFEKSLRHIHWLLGDVVEAGFERLRLPVGSIGTVYLNTSNFYEERKRITDAIELLRQDVAMKDYKDLAVLLVSSTTVELENIARNLLRRKKLREVISFVDSQKGTEIDCAASLLRYIAKRSDGLEILVPFAKFNGIEITYDGTDWESIDSKYLDPKEPRMILQSLIGKGPLLVSPQ